MDLREYLEEYKALTLTLIDEISKDGQLSFLIEKREDILKSINNINFDKEEIKTIGNSLKLLELEEELQNSVKKEEVKIKKEIQTLKKARQANANYNSIENKARVFNKNI
ncbi:MAG: hypothetical protein LLF98_05745 [Clostridium sp.]|uniref:hypothetical protein n=1 Tax=Clostridium sp. TaxID=1506 RepID=UPI0025BEC028|nr:hypothetical protein [Clostridium sp.]MCE5220770.1 hypothetical protein [Clostridium sp.]